MAKRKYNKKSDYWNKRSSSNEEHSSSPVSPYSSNPLKVSYLEDLTGDQLFDDFIETASCRTNAYGTTSTTSSATTFTNLDAGFIPTYQSKSGISVHEAIELTEKAYFNVSDVRNVIELMVDFCCDELIIEGGSVKSRQLLNSWLEMIKVRGFMEEFHREFWRSSNVIINKIRDTATISSYQQITEEYAALPTDRKFVVRFDLIHATDVMVDNCIMLGNNSYAKILNSYEIGKLKYTLENNPESLVAKTFLRQYPNESQQILSGNTKVEISLRPENVLAFFNSKQGYEPMAMPWVWPVLDDIEKKLELKKVDQAIARTVHNVILLVTAGDEPDKGGIDGENIKALRRMFSERTLGRTLVSDYTTKAEFVIPDLKKVMGKEKYEILNEDIKNGLQNILTGSEKFANTEIKAKVFLRRVQRARNAFMKDFLLPEIKQFMKVFKVRKAPDVFLKKFDLNDGAIINRTILRFAELGLIDAKEARDAFNRGFLNNDEYETIIEKQKQYKKDREDGNFNPLVGGVPAMESPDKPIGGLTPKKKSGASSGRPAGTTKISQQNTRKAVASVDEEAIFSISDVIELAKKASYIEKSILNQIDNPTDEIKGLVLDTIKSVVSTNEESDWEMACKDMLKNGKNNSISKLTGVNEIQSLYGLDEYPASLLYHCNERRINN